MLTKPPPSIASKQENAGLTTSLLSGTQSIPEKLFLLSTNEMEKFSNQNLSQEQRDQLSTHQIAIFKICWRILSYFGEETKAELDQRKLSIPKNEKDKEDNKTMIKREFGRPLYWRVSATAIVYFQRFYLCNSFSSCNPDRIMLACVLLAGKTEDCHVSLSIIKQIDASITKEAVYDMELQVLQALHFNVRVFHPRNILPTIIGDCRKWVEQQRLSLSSTVYAIGDVVESKILADATAAAEVAKSQTDEPDVHIHAHKKIKMENNLSELQSSASDELEVGSSEMRKHWLTAAEHITERLQCTHALFLYTPTEIAITVLRMCLQDITEMKFYLSTFDAYLSFRYGNQSTSLFSSYSSRVRELYSFTTSVDVSS